MGTRGPLVTVAPTPICSALLQLKTTLFAQKTHYLKPSYVRNDIETPFNMIPQN